MNPLTRRTFLGRTGKAGLTGAVAAGAVSTSVAAAAKGAADRVTLAMVGVRGRGHQLAQDFVRRSDCNVAYLCDVDKSLFPSRVKAVETIQGRAPKTEQDFRRALDDKSVDAIVVATPDHWHALATVWGCQAGKDVYVEKPASHTPWEGRQMVAAARKHQSIVQVGLQNRSAPYNMQAKKYISSGKLGKIHMVRVYNQKYWGNIKAAPFVEPPAHLDWNMWTGPAPESKYNTNYHGGWNRLWRFSGGDIINDGVHQMDLARWLIGKDYPKSVYATGGRFASEGISETPDTQVAVYQYDDMVMTFELTLYTPYMLKSDPVLRQGDIFPHWPQNATRIEIFGTKGLMVVGRHGGGWQVFDRPKSRKPVVAAQSYGRFPDVDHKQNFVDSIRSRKLPNADVLEGHRSTLLCQYANISYRLGGRPIAVDPKTEQLVDDREANALAKRKYRKPWVVPEIV